uniref:protein O-GlcNAc transferase n=1 Tax=Alexandrium monilatum TaxID=311494 RepID=A0A7S4S6Q4_9DINO
MQKYDKALINYQLTVHFNPRCAEAYNNMGVIFKERDHLERAFACYQMALQCNPRFAQALNNIGMACTATGRLQKALEFLARAVAVAPSYAEAYNNLGWLFWDQGDLEQALRMYERCIELAPNSKHPSQNRLLALNYAPDLSPQLVFEAHRAWGDRFCRELGPPCADGWPLLRREAGRRLRVGYISPDFFHHSVSFFAQCLLEHRDQDRFDIFIYSNTSREDEATVRLRGLVPEDRWKKVLGKSAQDVAGIVREDRIDILVELAGHTANNRLDVVALKPAPVQFTYIGYNNTTGLGAVDYRITDAIVDPLDSRQPFSEELVRLPGCFLCYTPPVRIPDVGPLPAMTAGLVTFGSFSCLAKVNQKCIALWARVLQEVPNSRLLVKAKGFYSREVQVRFACQFERHGIPAHRLRLLALTHTSYDHLNTYNEVDIGLDTFPYSNTTTTCETLLMGVPVVCLSGNTHGSRVGVTLLSVLGLSECVAETHNDYVDKAVRLATDLHRLALLRQSMRQALLASSLCDGPRFVRERYEPVLREKWTLFCRGRPPSKQHFGSAEPPDPLAPGPFVSPLPSGAAAAAAALCPASAATPQAAVANGAQWTQQLPAANGGGAPTFAGATDFSAALVPAEANGSLGSPHGAGQRLSPM